MLSDNQYNPISHLNDLRPHRRNTYGSTSVSHKVFKRSLQFTPTTTPLLSHMGCGCGHQILSVSGQK